MKRVLQLIFILYFTLGVVHVSYAQAPVANFSGTPTSSCAPLVVQFSDLSTNNPTSWYWTLGNGTISTLQNPSTTYTTSGTYTVTLTVTNASGTNTKSVINYITANSAPIVDFTANDTIPACGSKTVTFTNLTTTNSSGAASYYWDFGDGSTSTAVNPPAHTYSIPGTYSVSLVVTNGAGCTQVKLRSSYITVLAKPVAAFTASNTNSCTTPLTTSFTNTSTGASTYQWDFGDGSSSTAASPTHTYTSTGSYNVRLIATSAGGCKDTTIQAGLVNIGLLVASFSPSVTATCTGNSVAFTNTTSPGGGGSLWDFGDGTTSTSVSPSHVYSTAGTYTVKLKVSYNNCTDSTTRSITVNTGPATAFTGSPLSKCSAPLTVSFTNTTSGATSYQWIFGDGNTSTSTSPSNTYSSLGTYTVRLISTSSNGCKDTLTKINYVKIATPTATLNMNPYLGCAPASATFTPTVNSLDPISTYAWNFGDGNTGTGAAPSHTYSTAGTYTVTVTITTTTGCTFTASQPVVIGSHSTPAFTASPTTVCYNQPVVFTNSSTGATSYSWIFGNGGTSTASSPVYIYGSAGTYTVSLISANNGCNDTFTRANYITVRPPVATFTAANSCTNPMAFSFTYTSTTGTSFYWDFGDGATATTANPTHTYTTPGQYTVKLVAANSTTGCNDTAIKLVTAFVTRPIFTASDTVACKGQAIQFFSSAIFYTVNYYTVDYGDGSGLTNSFTHIYNSPGIYTVKYKLYYYLGCIDSVIKTNYIRIIGPSVNFSQTPVSGCKQLSVSFTDSSTTSAGNTISNRTWYFGDGSSVTTAATTVSHTYSTPGTFTVKLVVSQSASGCSDSLVKSNLITIYHPVASFSSLDTLACTNGTTRFINSSMGNSLSYLWDFGDGNTSTTTNPLHQYTSVGSYTVRLIVTDATGCKDTATRINYINVSFIRAGFKMSDSVTACPPFYVSFTNNSVNSVSSAWTFGNGSSSTITNPSLTYTTSGTFFVRLIATNVNGCKDTAIDTVIVGTGPVGTLSFSPKSGCAPLTVTFTATSNTTSLTYDFDNGVTNTATSSGSVSYTYTQSGTFHPKLIISNGSSCFASIVSPDSIKIYKASAGFKALPNPACAGSIVQFTDTSSAVGTTINSRSWSFGDGGTSTAANPTHVYSTSGTYSVRLIIGTSAGCPDTTYRTVTINPLPVITAAGKTICGNGSAQLAATGAATYTWSPAATLSCVTCVNPVATPAVTTIYKIIGTSAAGCVDSTTVTVNVNPVPAVNAGVDQVICSGNSAPLTATGAATYVWSPGTGLSATSGASVTASPAVTTAYVVIGSTALGCSDTDTVVVTVTPVSVVSVSPNDTLCAGKSKILTASGATTYSWSPSTGLSASTGATVTASPTTTTTYIVTGTANGCTDTASTTVTVLPAPVVNVGASVAICSGSSTTLTASGAGTYSWSPATGLSTTTGSSVVANPTVTTTYTIVGTSGTCTDTARKTVTVNLLPSVTASPNVSICIGASATITGSGASTYSWSPATGLSTTSTASTIASPTVTSTYIVTGTDGNGCIDTGIVVVTVNPLPAVSAGGNQSVCPGGSVTLTATGASTYVWSPGATLSCTSCTSTVARPVVTTTYTVKGTSALGCTDSARVTVTINTKPVVTVSGTTTICIGRSTSLTASGASSYSWSPATGLSATSGSTITANPGATTTYTIIGTSGVGCADTITKTITVNPLPIVNAGNDTAICIGAAAVLTASGASSYIWSPATSLSGTTGTTVTAFPTSSITYTATGTDANGCVNKDSVLVTVNPLPNVTASANNTSVCPGGSATLTASGGTSYVWTPGSTLSCTACTSPVATPAATTTYTVTGTNSNGCTDTGIVTVAVVSSPVVTITGNNTICKGDSATLTASGAGTYSWSPATGLSTTTGASVKASPTVTTTYTITGTSGLGCTGTTTVTVTVNSLPTVSAGADVAICAGTSTTLAASGASSYVWTPTGGLSSPTAATTSASPVTTTTYTVTGTSAGCSASANVTVTVNPLPGVSAGNAIGICPGDSVTLTATGASTYLWTPGATLSCTTCASPVAKPTATTTYTVTGTSTNGCKASSTVTVTVNQIPVIAVAGTRSICTGTGTTLTASGASTYSWSPAIGLNTTSGATVTASPTTTTTYTITGISSLGCTGTATVTVTVNPLPVVTANAPKTACLNVPVPLAAGGASTYTWTPAAGLSCTSCAAPIATPAATTTYTVVGIDNNGCIGSTQTTVTVLPLPNVQAGPDVSICKLNSVTLNASGAVSYIWSPAAGLSCTTCVSPVATPAVTTAYAVTGTGANGCTASDTVTVTLYAQPPVNAGPDQTICAGASAQLQASGASTYIWTPTSALSCVTCANPLSTPAATTTYMVAGTDINGCRDSDMVTITVIQKNPVSVDTGGAFCIGGSIQLHASGGDAYLWSPAAGLSCTECPDPFASPLTSTAYSVVIRQGQCFADTLSTTVVIYQLPTVNAGPDQSIVLGSTAQINATGTNISWYSWAPYDGLSCTDCPNPVAAPDRNTTYTVTVVSEAGCTSADSIKITVRCDGSQIWLPNTFTPNADGHNDFFYPHGKGISNINRFRIYNRWGELMYDKANLSVNDKNTGWDGTYKSQLLKPDVFVWVLNATCTNGEPLELKGDISLVR